MVAAFFGHRDQERGHFAYSDQSNGSPIAVRHQENLRERWMRRAKALRRHQADNIWWNQES
jgi:hypothetical protein